MLKTPLQIILSFVQNREDRNVIWFKSNSCEPMNSDRFSFFTSIQCQNKNDWRGRKVPIHIPNFISVTMYFNLRNSILKIQRISLLVTTWALSFVTCWVLRVHCTSTVVKLEVSDGHHSDIHNLLSITHKSMAIRRRNYLILNQNPFAVSFNLYISQ